MNGRRVRQLRKLERSKRATLRLSEFSRSWRQRKRQYVRELSSKTRNADERAANWKEREQRKANRMYRRFTDAYKRAYEEVVTAYISAEMARFSEMTNAALKDFRIKWEKAEMGMNDSTIGELEEKPRNALMLFTTLPPLVGRLSSKSPNVVDVDMSEIEKKVGGWGGDADL